MFASGIGFTRWYDSVPELAQAVRMMEKIPAPQQRAIAQVVLDSVDMNTVRYSADPSVKKLGTEKIMGLMKSKTKRRWYDQDPVVHQAFNLLFMMDDVGRREIGIRILFSIRVVAEAMSKMEAYALNRPPDVTPLVHSVFKKNIDYLMARTVVSPITAEKPLPLLEMKPPEGSTAAPESQTPAPEPPASTFNPDASKIETSDKGMKIIRLKKSQFRSIG